MVKKIIIPIAGLATRFLPLSKGIPKEVWPLVDKPVLFYIIEEVIASNLKQIIFVSTPQKKEFWNRFVKRGTQLKWILRKRQKFEILRELEEFEKTFKKISFTEVFQKKPLGDGHAILQAKRKVKNEDFAVAFGDDVIESKTPALLQMIKAFKKFRKPFLGLFRVAKEKISSYGIVKAKKIAERIYKIEKIVEKPKVNEAPSNLAIVGRYILTSEIFFYLEKAKPNKNGEIILADSIEKMIEEGKEVLGYEIKGKWLECGNKLDYLKSNFYLTLKHPTYGEKIREFLRAEFFRK